MASTNKTTNYELSQFLGTDKPAWLSDYNTDMSKIDTQMKANADAASGADGKADANATAIGTLANLTTDAKTSLVAAVNEVDSHADTAQNTANIASTNANTANTTANGVVSYLNISNYGSVESSDIAISSGSISLKNLHYASNSAGTLGKLYGYLYGVLVTGTSNTNITISNLPFDVSEQFNVEGLIFAQDTANKTIYYPTITFNTNNTATITFGSSYNGLTLNLYFNASVLFIQNFGD